MEAGMSEYKVTQNQNTGGYMLENPQGVVIGLSNIRDSVEYWATIFNQETKPLLERIAELEAALADATLFGDVNSGEIDFTTLHGKELETYFEARKRHLARKAESK
jgi:hypothetical protein